MDATNFENLNLHDSEIILVAVRYVEHGLRQVDVVLDYVEAYHPVKTSKKVLRFLDCQRVILDLNLDVVAPESIRTGQIVEHSAVRQELDEKLRRVGGAVPESLKHYRITTSSSAGSLDVLSTGVALLDDENSDV